MLINDIFTLNSQFGSSTESAGQVAFESNASGLVFVQVENQFARARLSLQGAHLLSWIPRGESEDILWVSKQAVFSRGRSIRGGIPICWPWFGAHPTEDKFPAHGFARIQDWKMVAAKALPDGRTHLAMELLQDNINEAYGFTDAKLELQITVGETLEMSLITRNIGEEAMTIGGAFHSYFNVSDIGNVTISGLVDQVFVDTLDGWVRKEEADPITINAEIDRVYFDNPSLKIAIEDSGWQRNIRINKQGSHSTVIWNPWTEKSIIMGDMGLDGYKSMICVETSNAVDDIIVIDPGEEHHLSVCYALDRD